MLRAAFARAGGHLHPGSAVRGIAAGPAGARAETADGDVGCRSLVIAAGAWSGELSRSLGLSLPVGLDVNMLTITEPAAPVMSGIVTHARGILTLKQYPNGTCMIGGGWQGQGSLADGRKDIDHDALIGNLRLAASIVPGLGALRIVRSWAGFEGVTPDLLPLFGRMPGHPHVYVTACCRGGFTQGLIFGRLMAELVTTGETSMPVAAFDPARFLR